PCESATAKYTVSQLCMAGDNDEVEGSPCSSGGDALSGENSCARCAKYASDTSSAMGTATTAGSATNHAASAKAMRSDSITACISGAVLKSAALNVGTAPDFSSSWMMPRAINATMPWPFGGCSHSSIPPPLSAPTTPPLPESTATSSFPCCGF